jgi:hypothetical protein
MLSLILPARNWHGDRIEACVRSFLRLKSTTLTEIVVVDFGSKEPIALKVRDKRVRVVRVEAERWSLAEAINVGVTASPIRSSPRPTPTSSSPAKADPVSTPRSRRLLRRHRPRRRPGDRSSRRDSTPAAASPPTVQRSLGGAAAAALGPGRILPVPRRCMERHRRLRVALSRLGQRGQRLRRQGPPLWPALRWLKPDACASSTSGTRRLTREGHHQGARKPIRFYLNDKSTFRGSASCTARSLAAEAERRQQRRARWSRSRSPPRRGRPRAHAQRSDPRFRRADRQRLRGADRRQRLDA